ncbi:MAG: 50S ribosomal protein L18 [Treponema sp. GWB1_62_6]|nr:MAG: 50S ribosomal protein L18 [Treponema sp. GWA1_62_8]OHE69614.1 MAG: 50S ribosomal protein L18 [Treponema sp. GWC1_61_84]OHE71299.1 MAG: 50S ribosomal protein L18 [Treponema sp. GWB1_62_6]OHE71527.1 MAG: 50S ribosomal protein L18 [Treponema sp. RIFOXYC1_FULL_61_9]HCM25052.1 50S ribosomal protein L18 [Treponema sp.]
MMRKLVEKDRKRLKRKVHIRKRIAGTSGRPRMSVFKSNRSMYIQVIDDSVGGTLVSASTLEKDLKDIKKDVEGAAKLGEIMGKRLLEKNITTVVFDRNGYLYHGIVKAIADGARKAGIQF